MLILITTVKKTPNQTKPNKNPTHPQKTYQATKPNEPNKEKNPEHQVLFWIFQEGQACKLMSEFLIF